MLNNGVFISRLVENGSWKINILGMRHYDEKPKNLSIFKAKLCNFLTFCILLKMKVKIVMETLNPHGRTLGCHTLHITHTMFLAQL